MNWYDITQLKQLEERLNKIGYKIAQSKWSNNGEYRIGVYPADDKNLLLSRDAEVFAGSTDQILCWLAGIEHRNFYLSVLGIKDKKIISMEEKEVDKRSKQIFLKKLKDPDEKISKFDEDLIRSKCK